MNYTTLKTQHRANRDTYPPSLALRTHRALSWLQRAEQEAADQDARFIFLWIAFNAAYANEIHDHAEFSERRLFLHFLDRLVNGDPQQRLYQLVWEQFPKSIRLLIDNEYVFQPFWDYQNGRIDQADWQQRFARSKAADTYLEASANSTSKLQGPY